MSCIFLLNEIYSMLRVSLVLPNDNENSRGTSLKRACARRCKFIALLHHRSLNSKLFLSQTLTRTCFLLYWFYRANGVYKVLFRAEYSTGRNHPHTPEYPRNPLHEPRMPQKEKWNGRQLVWQQIEGKTWALLHLLKLMLKRRGASMEPGYWCAIFHVGKAPPLLPC